MAGNPGLPRGQTGRKISIGGTAQRAIWNRMNVHAFKNGPETPVCRGVVPWGKPGMKYTGMEETPDSPRAGA